MDFSYELDPKIRIDLPTAKPKNPEANKKEFEELKQKMTEKQPFEYNVKLPSAAVVANVGKQQRSLSDEDPFERAEDASAMIEYGVEEE